MAAAPPPAGTVAGNRSCHLTPSQVQVSRSATNESPMTVVPPNMTRSLVAASKTSPARSRDSDVAATPLAPAAA
jgi:hypothetical protein